jgi:hypothetical protein
LQKRDAACTLTLLNNSNAGTSSPLGEMSLSPIPALTQRLSMPARIGMMLWAAATIAVFVFAMRLEPDPRGFGTHQQLGFPPCSFRVLWQIPCPSCGSTTAFAQFVRGHWISAAYANVGAFFLAVVLTASIPWCLVSGWKGQIWKVRDPLWTALLLMIVFMSLTALLWIGRLVALRYS